MILRKALIKGAKNADLNFIDRPEFFISRRVILSY